MYILNFTNAYVILMALCASLVLIILGKEFKKSALPAVALIVFLLSVLLHTYQAVILTDAYYKALATKSIAVDALMIFLCYVAYLWVDDIEAKEKNRKSIDNSLEWFWKKV